MISGLIRKKVMADTNKDDNIDTVDFLYSQVVERVRDIDHQIEEKMW